MQESKSTPDWVNERSISGPEFFDAMMKRFDAIDEIIASSSFGKGLALTPFDDEAKERYEQEREKHEAKAAQHDAELKMQTLAVMALVERVVVALEKIGSAADRYATSNEKAVDVATRGVAVLETRVTDHSAGATVSDSE